MRNFLILILLTVSTRYLSQNDFFHFDFGHNLDEEFYYEFIDESVPFLDLTQDKFFQEREILKISQVTKKHIEKSGGSYNLDKKTFNHLLQTGGYKHHYSHVEIFKFNKKGFKISKFTYPIINYLTKQDSLLCDRGRTTFVMSGDSLIVSEYIQDSVCEKTVYLDKIVYRIRKGAVLIMAPDSINKGHYSKVIGYKFFPTKYYYTDENKIAAIKCEDSSSNFYELKFQAEKPKKTLIKYSGFTFPEDTIAHFNNKILKNNLDQILTSTFYYTNIPEDFVTYSFIYDKHHNLIKVNRRTKAKGFFDYSEKLYEFKHAYVDGKLKQTLVHYNFSMNYNDVIYSYNENGLVSEIDFGSYKIHYDYRYSQDKN